MFRRFAKWILRKEMAALKQYESRGGMHQWWKDEVYRICAEYRESEKQRHKNPDAYFKRTAKQ